MTQLANKYQKRVIVLTAIVGGLAFVVIPFWWGAKREIFFGLALGLIFAMVRFVLKLRSLQDFGYVSARRMAASKAVSHLLLFCPVFVGWATKYVDIIFAGVGSVIPSVMAVIVAVYTANFDYKEPEQPKEG